MSCGLPGPSQEFPIENHFKFNLIAAASAPAEYWLPSVAGTACRALPQQSADLHFNHISHGINIDESLRRLHKF